MVPKTKRRRLTLPELMLPPEVSPHQRLLIVDTWRSSGLQAAEFAVLVGVSKHTLYAWKKRFEEEGLGGLIDRLHGSVKGSKLPDSTKRAILMMNEASPDWGSQRISDMLLCGPALPASPSAVLRMLHEAGYQLDEASTKPHPDKVRNFERARASESWQTDLFTIILKRQNRRGCLIAFMDDHSRFITGFGLRASQSAALVLEVITSYGNPEEILTDNAT